MPCAMADERALHAISRIERALARIETAAQQAPARDDRELNALRHAHQALRGKVQGAIAQIDRLLAANEGG
jgi:hypothetical protein